MTDKKQNQDFDLPILLKSDVLDIRRKAADNLSLSVEEYFGFLSEFTDRAEAAVDALVKIAAFIGNEKDSQSLADINTPLADLGCDKLVSEIKNILDLRENDAKSAGANAKKIVDDFNRLYTQTIAAKKAQDSEALSDIQNMDDSSRENYTASSQSLKAVLEQLEYEEANRKLRILAVDDAAVMLRTIISGLSDTYKVYGLTRPKLLEKTLKHMDPPELFLLDYKMPEISGFELVPIIRSFEEHKDTPIIFLTAMGTIDHLSTALMIGACDFVVKPVNMKHLREKIAKNIVRKKLF